MIFFDFLFYQFYKVYLGFNEKGAESTAAGVVGGIQALNALSVYMLLQTAFEKKAHIDKLIVILIAISFQIITYYRYIYREDHTAALIQKQWLSKSSGTKKQIRIILITYSVVSVIGCFALAIFLGNTRK